MNNLNYDLANRQKTKRKELNRIKKTVRQINSGFIKNPRHVYLVDAILPLIVFNGIIFSLGQSIIDPVTLYYYLAALSALVFTTAKCMAKEKPDTYFVMLDGLLSKYEPISKIHYISLKEEMSRKGGYGTLTDIVEWINIEKKAIDAIVINDSLKDGLFVNKKDNGCFSDIPKDSVISIIKTIMSELTAERKEGCSDCLYSSNTMLSVNAMLSHLVKKLPPELEAKLSAIMYCLDERPLDGQIRFPAERIDNVMRMLNALLAIIEEEKIDHEGNNT
ncbi:hypothetical protein D3C87_347920 [compost metagenome]